jgi:hypothetical protein
LLKRVTLNGVVLRFACFVVLAFLAIFLFLFFVVFALKPVHQATKQKSLRGAGF